MGLSNTLKRIVEAVTCAVIYYSGAIILVRWAQRKQIAIVRYHRINTENDPFFPAVRTDNFDRHVAYLSKRYSIISLEEALNHVVDGTPLPNNPAVITLDDGYKDNYLEAYPVLKKYGAAATIFLITGCMGTDVLPWPEKVYGVLKKTQAEQLGSFVGVSQGHALRNTGEKCQACEAILAHLKTLDEHDRDEAIGALSQQLNVPLTSLKDRDLMMSWEDVEEMADEGIYFGAHTVTHPILTRVSPERAREEITASVATVAVRTKGTFVPFCYPNGGPGDFNESVKKTIAVAGSPCACSTLSGLNRSGSDPFALKRISAGSSPTYRFAVEITGILYWVQRLGRNILNTVRLGRSRRRIDTCRR